MSILPLPSQTLANLQLLAAAGQCDAQALLHLLDRADKRDQDVAVFVDSYSRTIATLCRRLEALERAAGLRHLTPDAPADDAPSAEALLNAEKNLAIWCAKRLAIIRPVKGQHGIQTSGFPPADPIPAAPASLTPDDMPPAPLSEDDLRQRWNKQADEYNQWESLDSCEQLAWAQALAIRADRHAAALKAKPEGQRPTDEDLYGLAAEFNGDPVPAMRRALELWGNPTQGAPAPEPQTPPTDEAWWDELINEIARVQYVAAGEGQGGQIDLAKAVELWRRPAALPEPVPVAECPNCGYEGEMVQALQAGKVEA